MNFVTDTHALLWWFTDSPRISRKATDIFERCESGENVIFIPSIVLAEALSIFEKRRIPFDFGKLLKRIEDSVNFVIVPLDYPILQKMIDLKDIQELHDKIIVSTSRYVDAPIITKDETIQNLPHIKSVW
jgi:PIN domain nuclease of toxin-antitoxin system